jgi:hypothetical protein
VGAIGAHRRASYDFLSRNAVEVLERVAQRVVDRAAVDGLSVLDPTRRRPGGAGIATPQLYGV